MNIIPFIELEPAILPGKSKKGSIVERPCSSLSYGYLPANKSGFPEGNIYLRLGYKGYMKRTANGVVPVGVFGLRHIWEDHASELSFSCPSEVPGFVEKVISSGTPVLIDSGKNPDSPLVVNSSHGMAVLRYIKAPKEGFYDIITAYNRRNHPGTVIASIR